MDVAQLGIQVSTNGTPQKAADEINKLSGAATKAEAAIEGLRKSTGGAVGSVNAAARAYSDGAASVTKSTSALVAMNSAVNDNSRSATGFTNQARMMAMQLSQVAQQTQVTGNFLQSLAIQLPDLALGFGPIGIAAGIAAGAALTYFSSISSNAPDSAAALKQQAELIQDVADRWGAAVPALQSYVNELERAKDVGDLKQAYDALERVNWDSVRAPLEDINVQFADMIVSLRQAGGESEEIDKLNDTFQTLRKGVEDGTASVSDLQAVQDALTGSMRSSGIQAVDDFAAAFGGLANQIFRAANEANRLSQERLNALTTGQNGPKLGTLGPLWSENGSIMKEEDFVPTDAPTPSRRPLIELEGLGGRAPRTRAASNDNYKSSISSIQERTKAIQAETAAQASLNPLVNDYDYAITKARTSANLLAAAEKAKKALTPELIAQIDQTSSALASATEAQNRQTEAIQKAKQAMEFVKNTTLGFVNDLRDGLKNGEGFWKSFGKAALNVLDRITDKLLGDVMDAVFKVGSAGSGTGGGGLFGFLGGLFGGGNSAGGFNLGSGATAYTGSLPGYATGTSSARPGIAWVGETGPELVRFKGGEEVVPNHRLQVPANQNAGGQNGNVNISIAPVFNAANADDAGLAALRSDFAKFRADVPATIVSTVKDAQKRRMI
ncbi:hypothetical protein [Rhizobium sp. S163]|uniref:hypothetical protein n=1 Tax=Rhizobium sp. S163 TaxID=3055039 RepID=UPI0025A946FA|nr:hypothetical protein [Rhizobium sp. S163]MDM9644464.1 hypothetical protein [Rhizobium sp. S163]